MGILSWKKKKKEFAIKNQNLPLTYKILVLQFNKPVVLSVHRDKHKQAIAAP